MRSIKGVVGGPRALRLRNASSAATTPYLAASSLIRTLLFLRALLLPSAKAATLAEAKKGKEQNSVQYDCHHHTRCNQSRVVWGTLIDNRVSGRRCE